MAALRHSLALVFFLAAVALSACASVPENQPLPQHAANQERRSIIPADPGEPVIMMAFSGGGSRAAALAASVLGELKNTHYPFAGQSRRLADDVKLISSVSGGSVTAAWFGLTGPDGLQTLRDNFLAQDNMTALELTGANPITWFRLAFTGFTRIDALEELLDKELFAKKTFKELDAAEKPFVILNATDMGSGQVFAFTPRRFDDICSSLDELPISVGVASSAAFPVLLSPVNFHNNSVACAGTPADAEWMRDDLVKPATPYLNLPEYRDARYSNDLRRGEHSFRDVRELHFLDGGLADNLGFGSLRAALLANYDDTQLVTAINDGKIGKLVVIAVNARSDPPSDLDQDPSRPGLVSVVSAVVSIPIDATTASVESQLSALLTDLGKAASQVDPDKAKFAKMKVYAVMVDFDQLPATTDEERRLRDAVKTIPTSWSLTKEQLDMIDKVGPLLLRRDPCFRQLLKDLGADVTGDSVVSASACNNRVRPPS